MWRGCALRFSTLALALAAAPVLPAGRAAQLPQGGGAVHLVCDPALEWSVWWQHNRHRLLARRRAPSTLSEADVAERILPALQRVLLAADERSADLAIAAMFALAEAGRDLPDLRLVDALRPRLAARPQEVGEAAVLALAVGGRSGARQPEACELLMAIARDDEVGRAAVGAPAVRERTRAFATYGLGLVAAGTADIDLRQQVFATLRALLEDDALESREIRVGAIHGLGLLRFGDDATERARLVEVLGVLRRYYLRPLGADHEIIQAHCPAAIARLLGRGDPLAAGYRALLALDLRGDGQPPRAGNLIARSAALALGRLCRPIVDADYSQLLFERLRAANDEVTRCYSALALGEIGGAPNRANLLAALSEVEGPTKCWCALALGVLSSEPFRAAPGDGERPVPDAAIGKALAAELEVAHAPALVGVLALASGLGRHVDAAPRLRQLLVAHSIQPELAGHLCLALALMNDRDAIDDMRGVMAQSRRAPILYESAALALSRLGDDRLTDRLLDDFTGAGGALARVAVTTTVLGDHGDRRAVAPLQEFLLRGGRNQLERAFAAAALGRLAARDPLPWNGAIAAGVNLSAAVATLTDTANGVLDYR